MKIAWFSPLPPSTSGIAAYSTELLPRLAARGHAIETFDESSAHDFVWKQRRQPYDLTVFQMGNAACHDYMWAYLFRYPGLMVLHDGQLHQARALALTRRWVPRRDDYLAEFRANHPDAPPELGEVVAAGFGDSLYQHWPHIRLVVESARLTVVHNRRLLADLRERHPNASLDAIEMGVADPLAGERQTASAAHKTVRERHGIPSEAIVLAAFGGITPEKRFGSILRTLSTIRERHPLLHCMVVGGAATHYDVVEDAKRWGVTDRVHVTGYVADAELSDYLLAADLCACLRWPTNRETSASWLRCLAAGRATLITDLADLGDVPTRDPRGWGVLDTSSASREPIAVSIDVVDEEHTLQLALDRLVRDDALRARLGAAGRAWWAAHHQLDAMADAYHRVIATAIASPAPPITLPPHLTDDASESGRAIADRLGVASLVADVFRN